MTLRIVEIDRPSKRYTTVQKVMKIERGADGVVTRTILSEKQSKRRVSKRWRGVDKTLRRIGRAQRAAATEYLDRHERANERKKNGAIKKLPKNLMKAQRKGMKQLKIKIFS